MSSTIYDADPNWRTCEEGTKSRHYRKMFALLHQPESPFQLHGKLNFIRYNTRPFTYFQFRHPEHGDFFTFFPTNKLKIYIRNKSEKYLEERDNFVECFRTCAKLILKHPKRNMRFVLPITEPGYSGNYHAISLVIDFNASKKQVIAHIYDSIGRSTIADSIALLFGSKDVKGVSDPLIAKYIKQVFPKSPDLKRIGYNHQNRATSKQCALFAFRVLHQAAVDFSHGRLGLVRIPNYSSIICTDSSFLTSDHIDAIEQCVRYEKFTFQDLIAGFRTIKYFEPKKEMVKDKVGEDETPDRLVI